MSAPAEVRELVKRFYDNEADYLGNRYKEARARREFIDPIFSALGWDMDNSAGWAEAYKEVVHEDSLDVEGATKAPDYCFRVGGARKFFVEAKAPHVKLDRGTSAKEAAFQLKRYAWSAKLPVGIVTNFRQWAAYDCTKRPKPTSGPAVDRLIWVQGTDLITRWSEIAEIFDKDSILRGSFDRYVTTTQGRRGTAEVDAQFLLQLNEWRELLAVNIATQNQSISSGELNSAVQTLIDRMGLPRYLVTGWVRQLGWSSGS